MAKKRNGLMLHLTNSFDCNLAPLTFSFSFFFVLSARANASFASKPSYSTSHLRIFHTDLEKDDNS